MPSSRRARFAARRTACDAAASPRTVTSGCICVRGGGAGSSSSLSSCTLRSIAAGALDELGALQHIDSASHGSLERGRRGSHTVMAASAPTSPRANRHATRALRHAFLPSTSMRARSRRAQARARTGATSMPCAARCNATSALSAAPGGIQIHARRLRSPRAKQATRAGTFPALPGSAIVASRSMSVAGDHHCPHRLRCSRGCAFTCPKANRSACAMATSARLPACAPSADGASTSSCRQVV
mmetsp:Transcript_2007/g.5368  ORF Transcript_2007/g.5368 Transcript_2007/m.5368 type:complete len:242 (-) Transcript_2007:185-910(-)